MGYLCMLATSSLTNLGTPLLITFLCLCHHTCILNQDSMEIVLPFCTFEDTTHRGWWFLVVNSFHATGFVRLNLECTALFNDWITQHYGVGGNAYWWMAFVINTKFCIDLITSALPALSTTRIFPAFNDWITQHYGVGGNAYWWMAFVINTKFCIDLITSALPALSTTRIFHILITILPITA